MTSESAILRDAIALLDGSQRATPTGSGRSAREFPPKTFGMGGPGSGITVCVPAATSGSQCFTNNVIYHELLHKCVPNSMAPPNHAFIFNTAFQAFSCGE